MPEKDLHSIRDTGKKIGFEAITQLIPFADIAIAIYQTIQKTVEKEQAEATTAWIAETYATSLRISPRQPDISKIAQSLDARYSQAALDQKSYMPGTRTSMVFGNRLIQWFHTSDDDQLLFNPEEKPGMFRPDILRNELQIFISNRWKKRMVNGAFIGDEYEILESTEDAATTIYTLTSEQLSPFPFRPIKRHTATLQESDTELPVNFESWEDMIVDVSEHTGIQLTNRR